LPPKTKVVTKKCKVLVRTESGNRETCDVEYTGEKCPQPDPHLNAFKTGFCSNGWCEGTKAKTWKGTPAPTCKFWETCPCDCHDLISKMFAMSDMERIPVDESGYVAEDGGFKRITDADRAQWAAERAARSSGMASDAPLVIESPAPGIVPPSIQRTFRPTASGRAARGELETQINQACAEWLVEQYPWPCTPLWISETIGKAAGIKPPSTGAITAALDKWQKLGYASVARKPVRFTGFTEEGIRLGLEVMKEEHRRKRDQIRSELERGVRR
jgi:hypothetical protein